MNGPTTPVFIGAIAAKATLGQMCPGRELEDRLRNRQRFGRRRAPLRLRQLGQRGVIALRIERPARRAMT